MHWIRSPCRSRRIHLLQRWIELLVHCVLQLFLTTKVFLLWTLNTVPQKAFIIQWLKRQFIQTWKFHDCVDFIIIFYSSWLSFVSFDEKYQFRPPVGFHRRKTIIEVSYDIMLSKWWWQNLDFCVNKPIIRQRMSAVPDFQTGWIHWWLPELLWLVPPS